jgi:hypothetical protein
MLIVEHIAGERQMADILTKALEVVTFLKHVMNRILEAIQVMLSRGLCQIEL